MRYYLSMQIIPEMIPIIKDEELTSWLCRLARANAKYCNAEGTSAFSGKISFMPVSYTGIGSYLDNMCQQMDADPISLILDHTTFCCDQICMTRSDHENHVKDMFAKRNSGSDLLSNKEFYCCPSCAEEDESKYGFHYIHLDHQLSPGFCYKHFCKTHKINAEHFINLSIDSMQESLPVSPQEAPSLLEKNDTQLRKKLISERTIINYDDAVEMIEYGYKPSTLFVMDTVLDVENQESEFLGSSTYHQNSYLSDAYRYLIAGEDKGFKLDLYPNLLTSLLAESLHHKYMADELPDKQAIRISCVLESAKQQYQILSDVQPIMAVKNVRRGTVSIVSIYAILDGIIDSMC